MKFICYVNGRPCKLQMTYKTAIVREVNGVIIKEPTEYIQFDSDGTYSTDDSNKIAFIKRNSMYGLQIHGSEEEEIQKPSLVETPIETPKKRGRPKRV